MTCTHTHRQTHPQSTRETAPHAPAGTHQRPCPDLPPHTHGSLGRTHTATHTHTQAHTGRYTGRYTQTPPPHRYAPAHVHRPPRGPPGTLQSWALLSPDFAHLEDPLGIARPDPRKLPSGCASQAGASSSPSLGSSHVASARAQTLIFVPYHGSPRPLAGLCRRAGGGPQASGTGPAWVLLGFPCPGHTAAHLQWPTCIRPRPPGVGVPPQRGTDPGGMSRSGLVHVNGWTWAGEC